MLSVGPFFRWEPKQQDLYSKYIFSPNQAGRVNIFTFEVAALLSFWCLSVQNTAGSNIQRWVYGGGQNYERSWGKLS